MSQQMNQNMSRPLVPRASRGLPGIDTSSAIQRARKISTACGACKQRKTRCSGGNPCDACATRNSQCIYDATTDQRRKIANQRNVQDLAEAQADLEKHRQVLGGIIATIRAGDAQSNQELLAIIRSDVDLSQLAAYVRNECRSNPAIQQAYNEIEFVINGGDDLPSPTQMLNIGPSMRVEPTEGSAQLFEPSATMYGGDFSMFGLDGERQN